MASASSAVRKIDVKPEWWDTVFAPSSCLVLITTVDADGRVNAAPFGTCTRVCHDPVYVAFTCSTGKDTTNNVLATGEFVVNTAPFERQVLEKLVVCGLPFKPGLNELEKAGLAAIPARVLRPPRIVQCYAHFECKVEWTRPWRERVMICGRVEAVSVNEDCIDGAGFLVWDKAKPAHYCGRHYKASFVAAHDRLSLTDWRYDGTDDEFREDEDWRNAYRHGGVVAD